MSAVETCYSQLPNSQIASLSRSNPQRYRKYATGRRAIWGFESCVLKRFTETTKWDDSWFMGLSPVAKLLWIYLCDHCDNAGVIDLNAKLAAFQIGQAIEENHFIELGERIRTLENGKLWLPKFIKFQYGTLSGGSLVHQSVVRLIQSHALDYPTPSLTHSQASDMGCASHKEKRKEKVQEEEKDRKGVQGETKGNGRITEVASLLEELGIAIYARKDGQRPTEPEERTAVQIVQRSDWQSEKEEILVFNRIVMLSDRRYEIPKTLSKLLDEWDSTLDKARNYHRPLPPGSKGGESVKDRNGRLAEAAALRAIATAEELTKDL